MFYKTVLLGGATLAALSTPVLAQTVSEDEIITTALRAISPQDVTSSLSILEFDNLAIRSSPYIADQLRAVPGVGISRTGSVGGLTQIRIRGAEANHTLFLVNGVEVSNPVTGETDFGLWSGLNTSRIEVARGEQSALYGSDAIGGVISLTTGGEGFQGAVEYGSFETLRGNLAFNKEIETLKFGLSASGFQTDGVDTAGLDGERDGSDSYSLAANASLDITPEWNVSAFTSFRRSNSQFDSDTDFDGLLNDIDSETRADQWIVGASATGQTGVIDHILRANFSDVELENTADGDFTNATTGQRTKLSYSPSVSLGAAGADITLSGVMDWEGEDYERVDTNTLFGDPNQAQSFNSYGIGGEARARFAGAVLNGSVRFDDNDGRFENAATWRVGGAYNFEYGGKLRASIGEGVKNPTFTELFGFFPGSFIGNPNLNPEKSQSWEVGYDFNVGDINASATYFEASLEDEIFTAFNPDFTSTAANREGNSDRSGVEVSADWALNEAFSVSGAISNISSQNDSGVDEIRVPEWTASAAMNWQSLRKEGFRAGVALDYVGSQDDFNFGTFPAARVTLDSYVLISATAEYPVFENLSLTLRGENLLDETTIDVFGNNAAGAGVFIGFKLR